MYPGSTDEVAKAQCADINVVCSAQFVSQNEIDSCKRCTNEVDYLINEPWYQLANPNVTASECCRDTNCFCDTRLSEGQASWQGSSWTESGCKNYIYKDGDGTTGDGQATYNQCKSLNLTTTKPQECKTKLATGFGSDDQFNSCLKDRSCLKNDRDDYRQPNCADEFATQTGLLVQASMLLISNAHSYLEHDSGIHLGVRGPLGRLEAAFFPD